MTRKALARNPRSNHEVKPLAIQVAPPAPLPSVALEGEVMEPEGFEPIPHNDQKAIGDAVNHLLENQTDSDEVEDLKSRVSELEAKMERLLSAWGDPDDEAGKGGSGDADKH